MYCQNLEIILSLTCYEGILTEKFERGAQEHPGDWSLVDPIKELKEELIDLYWYASHSKFPYLLGQTIRFVARFLWTWLS